MVRSRQAVLLGPSSHFLDYTGRTAPIVGDGDAVRLSGGLVGDRDDQDIVGVDVGGNFDLGDTAGSRWDTGELQFAKEVVILGMGTLTLGEHPQPPRRALRTPGDSGRSRIQR